ncbi:MAG: alpha/beta hydrolase [Flavobacteriaceae bacterium]
MKVFLKSLLAFLLLAIIFFAFGPRVDAPNIDKPLPKLAISIPEIPQWVAQQNNAFPNIKPGNESQLIFADSIPQKTPYAIVYLHGFSGSTADGAPVHKEVAKALGANIYLPRLYDHGLATDEGLINYTGEKSLDSAREALAVGKLLGEKVILMGTSTGCTLALTLAAQHPELAALVLYAPNIRINHPLDFVATLPWGLQIIRQVEGGLYHSMENPSETKQQYWTTNYRLEAPVQMQKLLETAMIPATFEKVTVPVFSGYYYKNEQEQDPVVSVAAMRKMFQELGTVDSLKVEKAFPDAGAHEIASHLVTQHHDQVKKATLEFLNRILD